jgi:autotransporter-associated beta strand protein
MEGASSAGPARKTAPPDWIRPAWIRVYFPAPCPLKIPVRSPAELLDRSMIGKTAAACFLLLLTTLVASAQDPLDFYTRTGTDPTFQQLIDSGAIVPGVSASPGPVNGSTINVDNALLEAQTGNQGNLPTDFRIHTQVNSSILRSNFPNFTRWYQEDGRIQVMRLFQGEQNVRSGVGPDGTPGRIEAFFPAFTVPSNSWSVWEGTYTIIDPLQSNIFQLFHEGGQLWAFHLRMTNSGTIYFSRRRAISGLPSEITIATNMVGKSISFMVRSNGTQYELYKRTPLPLENWELVTTGSYTPAVDRKISYRWGMYHGSQAGQSIPNDGLLFVNGIKRYAVDAPGQEPPPPPPPVPMTYHWDNNGATAGFGNAGGVWGETTSGGTQGWSTDTTGATLPDEVSTNSVDAVFFGTNSTGLGTGSITVSDTVDCGDLTFGSQSGNITLNGGEIAMHGDRTIRVAGTGKIHGIGSVLSGGGTRMIAGSSTLSLTGTNTFSGPLIIGDAANSSLRLRISGIGNANGTPSAAGAPASATDGIIQIGSGSFSSTLELAGSTSGHWTNRRIRIGSNGTGSGSATIQNNNSNAAHTLTFTNSAFNVAATDTASFNRTLTLGGSNTGDNTIQGAIINNSGGSGGRVALIKSGGGTWTLAGANTYSGGTSISGGTLEVVVTQTASALGTGTVSVGAGATLILDNRSTTNVANVPEIANTFTGSGLLKLQFSAGTAARNTYLPDAAGFGGIVQLSNAGPTGDKWNASNLGTLTGSLVVDSGSTLFTSNGTTIFNGGITLDGDGNSEGRGAIRVSGAGTILGGDIHLAGSSTIGIENTTAQVTGNIRSGAEGTQVLSLGGTQGSQSGGTVSGNIGGGSGTLQVKLANGSYTLSGNLSHGGGITVTGGLLALGGPANSYTGVTAVGAGSGRSLLVNAAGALGATGPDHGTTIGTNGQLGFSGGIHYTAAERIVGSGPGATTSALGPFEAAQRGFIQSVSGNNTFAGDIEITSASRIGTQDGALLTLTGAITQTAGNILFRAGNLAGDFVTLANPGNTFGGDSTVFTAATRGNWAGLRLGANNALPTHLTLSGFSGTGTGTALDLNGWNQTLNGLIDGATLNIVNLDTAEPSILTLNPTADKSTASTVIAGGEGLGVIHVVKEGSFTQVLAGTHTYTGSTSVNQGTLALVGATISSPIAVAHGASLGFTLGIPASSTSSLDLSRGTVKISGEVDHASSYTLLTASAGIGGTPVLGSPIPGYELRVEDGGTKLVLAHGTSYASWAATHAGGQGPDQDFDADGAANGIEFFLNATPGFTPLPTLDATRTITWTNGGMLPASAYGTRFLVQISGNLVDWSDVPLGRIITNTGGPGGSLAYTLDTPEARFVRLKVTPE